MTQADEHAESRATYRPRTYAELTRQQLAAIERFHQARSTADAVVGASREERLDMGRRHDVMRREHDAIVARCDEQLRLSGEALWHRTGRRVVLAHRSEWFLAKVGSLLEEDRVRVVARLSNGADAVGTVIAEQPDLLLVEDSLAMLSGAQVIRELQLLSPNTVVVAQVPYSDRVGPLLDAGAAAVFTRQIPPADVAEALLDLLTADRA